MRATSMVRPLIEWACPANIQAAYTTRGVGPYGSPYANFNLATHVQDD